MSDLPHCDELFQRYFAIWCSQDELAARGFTGTRPDIGQYPERIGKPAAEVCSLSEDVQQRMFTLPGRMIEAATIDFGKQFELSPPVDLRWIQQIDDYYDVDHISDPTQEGNRYYITCIELGALIAKVMIDLVPDLEWLPDWPYWEWALWHPPTGQIIPPTHWAIKKFSSYGWEDGLVPKIMACTQILRERAKTK